MNFEFENGEENVVATLAFALYGDNAISTAYADKPLSIYQMTQVLGQVINSSIVKSGQFPSWVDRRDEIHRIARCFCDSLQAQPAAAVWEKADKEAPDIRDVLFTVKRDRAIYKGVYNRDEQTYTVDKGETYPAKEVAYWCPCPSAPLESDEELDYYPQPSPFVGFDKEEF